MNSVDIEDAKTQLHDLVERAETGDEIVITRNGKPAARLLPLAPTSGRRAGGWEGRVWIAPDFDEAG